MNVRRVLVSFAGALALASGTIGAVPSPAESAPGGASEVVVAAPSSQITWTAATIDPSEGTDADPAARTAVELQFDIDPPVASADQSVTVQTIDGTAVSSGTTADFDAIEGEVIALPLGAVSGTVTVSVVPDNRAEADEGLQLQLISATSDLGIPIGAASKKAVTIVNDDGAGSVRLSAGNLGPYDEGGSYPMRLTRLVKGNQPIFVQVGEGDSGEYLTPGDFALVGADPDSGILEVEIPAGGANTSSEFDVQVIRDGVFEDAETLQLKILGVSGGGTAGDPLNLIIPANGTVSYTNLTRTTDNGPENGLGTFQFRVTRTAAERDSTVQWYTRGKGSAPCIETTRADFGPDPALADFYTDGGVGDGDSNPGSLDFSGEQSTRNIVVTVHPDSIPEDDQSFEMVLLRPTTAGPLVAQATIENDDGDATYEIEPENIAVDEGARAELVVVQSQPAQQASAKSWVAQSVLASTTGDSPNTPDVTVEGGDVLFCGGDPERPLTTKAINDSYEERAEPIAIRLGNVAQAIVTINASDDQPGGSATGTPILAPNANPVPEGKQATVQVNLNREAGQPFRLSAVADVVPSGSGSATRGDFGRARAQSGSGVTRIAADQGTMRIAQGFKGPFTFKVPITEDGAFEGQERFVVWLKTEAVFTAAGAQAPAIRGGIAGTGEFEGWSGIQVWIAQDRLGQGLRVVSSDGKLRTFRVEGTKDEPRPVGRVTTLPGTARLDPGDAVAALSSTADGKGYRAVTFSGRVLAGGSLEGQGYGSLVAGSRYVHTCTEPGNQVVTGRRLEKDLLRTGDRATRGYDEVAIGIANTATGDGYLIATNYGRIWAFGAACYRPEVFRNPDGSTTPRAVRDVDFLQLASSDQVTRFYMTPGDDGYWLFGANGGVYAFGAAPMYGSIGRGVLPESEYVIGVAVAPNLRGYYLVTNTGGVYGFGSVPDVGDAKRQFARVLQSDSSDRVLAASAFFSGRQVGMVVMTERGRLIRLPSCQGFSSPSRLARCKEVTRTMNLVLSEALRPKSEASLRGPGGSEFYKAITAL